MNPRNSRNASPSSILLHNPNHYVLFCAGVVPYNTIPHFVAHRAAPRSIKCHSEPLRKKRDQSSPCCRKPQKIAHLPRHPSFRNRHAPFGPMLQNSTQSVNTKHYRAHSRAIPIYPTSNSTIPRHLAPCSTISQHQAPSRSCIFLFFTR